MVNPAILAGLLAGYTVSALVTALVAAEDPTPRERRIEAAVAAHPASTGTCARALRRSRRAARCLVGAPLPPVTTQRR
jgi:hypothetical protein